MTAVGAGGVDYLKVQKVRELAYTRGQLARTRGWLDHLRLTNSAAMASFINRAESSYLFRVLGVIKSRVPDRVCSIYGEQSQKLVDILLQD